MVESSVRMYGLHDFARMIADEVRMEAYVRALERTVRPGSVVVDIGTGTGILALVACRLGARRVYAIDTNDAIEVARELARENGCADRIEFLQEDALRVKLPERGDLVISDLRGGMPFGAGNLPVVAYAREHLLASGGVLIPERDVLMAAIVSNAPVYERAVGRTMLGATSLTAMRTRLSNMVHRDRTRSVRPSDLMAPGATWGTLEYATVVPRPVHGHADWRIAREGTGHGLLLWFEAVLAGGQGFSTAPGLDVVYPQLFLPWTEPVFLHEGDAVAVDLWAQAEGESWGWNTDVAGRDGAKRAQYKQSTFLADVIPLKTTRRTTGDKAGPS